jgi:hypothetical protein
MDSLHDPMAMQKQAVSRYMFSMEYVLLDYIFLPQISAYSSDAIEQQLLAYFCDLVQF